jgi:hypothetical protein
MLCGILYCLFLLYKKYFHVLFVAGGKCVPKGKSKLSRECTAIDLELKIRMIHKYEFGHSLSAIEHELSLAVYTVNTSMKDAACIKEHAKGMAMMTFYDNKET